MISVFDVIINVKKINGHNLYLIKDVVYKNLNEETLKEYVYIEYNISKKILDDPQTERLCNLLLNTFILRMYNSLQKENHYSINLDYEMMLSFLKQKYNLEKTKIFTNTLHLTFDNNVVK